MQSGTRQCIYKYTLYILVLVALVAVWIAIKSCFAECNSSLDAIESSASSPATLLRASHENSLDENMWKNSP